MRRTLSPVEFEVPVQAGWTRLVDLLSLLALAALAVWWSAVPAADAEPVRGVMLLLGLAATLIGWRARRAQPCRLRWDGRQWLVSADPSAGPSTPGHLRVVVDLQHAMLLRFESVAGSPRPLVRWIAVDRRTLQPDWHLLRCAAFRQTCPGAGAAALQRPGVPE